MDTEITDDNGRVILIFGDNGKILVGRFTDMSNEYKKFIVDVYSDAVKCTSEDLDHLIRFLNFEDNNDEFCV